MEIAELTSVVERLTARDRRREGGVRTRGRGIQESSPTGARGLAVALDASERSMRPYREATSDDGRDAPIPAWRLGTGVAPDRAESVDAVLAMVPRTILIDGYNVAASLDVKDFATRSGRDRVLVAANTLARATTAEVIVVFDAAGVDGRGTYRGDLGVSIRFSTQQSADDLIVALVERGTRSVVVSNDRELRERAEALGALAIWADALVGWISLRGRGSNP